MNPYSFLLTFVKQLFIVEGNLMSYREFLEAYHIPVSPKEFAIVIIPKEIITLFKGTLDSSPSYSCPWFETNVGKKCSSRNEEIRSILSEKRVCLSRTLCGGKSHIDKQKLLLLQITQ